ncbi:MAG: sulfite exporter TauE/SafE family protein [Pseudomonadales bacterium]|nr:MAG: sulfite exporter TauE/SafE family protein [Pseudomonadales bacterium]
MIAFLSAILAGIAVGLSLGLTGSGGSLFAIPLLLYVLNMDMQSAVPISLLVVGITALSGAVSALRTGLLHLKPTLVFGAAGIVAAPAGLRLGALTPDIYQEFAFVLLVFVMAGRMAIESAKPGSARVVRANLELQGNSGICRYAKDGRMDLTLPCIAALVLAGGVVGGLSGFLGVGGGFLIVPALMYVIRMDISFAIGSSLTIIAMIGITGGALAGLSVLLSSTPAILFGLGSLGGMFLGRMVAGDLSGKMLQRVFSLMLLATGLFMLYQLWGNINVV